MDFKKKFSMKKANALGADSLPSEEHVCSLRPGTWKYFPVRALIGFRGWPYDQQNRLILILFENKRKTNRVGKLQSNY